jgi:GxxExxY protein
VITSFLGAGRRAGLGATPDFHHGLLRYDELVIHRAYQADFIVENEVVIEVKALATVGQRERRQLQTYLELEGFPLGLLLNFGATRLVDGIKRVVNHFPEGTRGASGHKA